MTATVVLAFGEEPIRNSAASPNASARRRRVNSNPIPPGRGPPKGPGLVTVITALPEASRASMRITPPAERRSIPCRTAFSHSTCTAMVGISTDSTFGAHVLLVRCERTISGWTQFPSPGSCIPGIPERTPSMARPPGERSKPEGEWSVQDGERRARCRSDCSCAVHSLDFRAGLCNSLRLVLPLIILFGICRDFDATLENLAPHCVGG